jgi:lipid-A-disaccharide synthase
MPKDLLVIAGEASGDQHGAELVRELKRLAPDLRCFGIGGQGLQAEGAELVGRSSEIAVVGISEVVKVLGRARALFRSVLAETDRRGADVAVLIDSPEFNLRLAKQLKRRGVVVVYYISPQLWAWRPWRVRVVQRVVDEMLVLFAFEVDFYRRHGVEAIHVGHPLVEQVPELPQAWDETDPVDTEFRVALLPGSRASEVERLLPTLCKTAATLAKKLPVRFQLIRAPTVEREQVDDILASVPVEIEVVEKGRLEAIAASHLALCASGTATLEVGLLRTPMIVVYKVSGWTWYAGRLLVNLPYCGMVNLVLGEMVVPELLQQQAVPDKISAEAEAILMDPERVREMRSRLGDLRSLLGEAGASRRAAEVVARRITKKESAG